MAARSGFITVGTSGAAITGPASGAGTFMLRANPFNTGTHCWVGDMGTGDVGSTNGFALSKALGNQVMVTVGPGGLAGLYFDSDTDDDSIAYLLIIGEGGNPPAA